MYKIPKKIFLNVTIFQINLLHKILIFYKIKK